jgi:type I restriction enzyme R subunit
LIEDRFEEDSYRLMIVASKFQTGFDQPLLAGMFLDKAVADRNAVQTISRLNRCHPDKDGVVVVDFTNNARAILKAFNKYRHGSPHDPDEPDPQKCIDLYDEIIGKGVFSQADAEAFIALLKANKGGTVESRVNELRIHFNAAIPNVEERKAFVYLLAKFVKSFHFLSAFFSYEKPITGFAAFCEYVGPQLIKAGSVSDLMKQIRATVVEKAAVTDQGTVNMPAGQTKPKPSKGGGGGGGAPVKRVSVQDMIAKIREEFQITEEEALHIREVSEEKIADESVQQTVAAHRADLGFLNTVYRDQINGGIQDAYTLRQLYEQLADPKYTDKTGIFDIMALTVIQKGLELAEAS